MQLLMRLCAAVGRSPLAVAQIVSVDVKADEEGLLALAGDIPATDYLLYTAGIRRKYPPLRTGGVRIL